ncbi:MAG: putative toxin-antitoxin system toxin component, PIN family [Nitrospira sp.]|nr:putative toxin-antitoxin system toxin component, PIN family [Nitrospira sp.]
MKVVVDTNVLISAILKDKEPETVLLFIANHPEIEWIVSPQVLEEYKEVIGREKFGLPDNMKDAWFNLLNKLTNVIDAGADIDFPRDQKDAKFLSCAIAANADYFITGDKDFGQAQKFFKTVVISVAQFKRLVCDVMT